MISDRSELDVRCATCGSNSVVEVTPDTNRAYYACPKCEGEPSRLTVDGPTLTKLSTYIATVGPLLDVFVITADRLRHAFSLFEKEYPSPPKTSNQSDPSVN